MTREAPTVLALNPGSANLDAVHFLLPAGAQLQEVSPVRAGTKPR